MHPTTTVLLFHVYHMYYIFLYIHVRPTTFQFLSQVLRTCVPGKGNLYTCTAICMHMQPGTQIFIINIKKVVSFFDYIVAVYIYASPNSSV